MCKSRRVRKKKKGRKKKKEKPSRINQTWPAALTSWSHSGHPALDVLPVIKLLFTWFLQQWAGSLSHSKSLILLFRLGLGLCLRLGLRKPQSPGLQAHCNYKRHAKGSTALLQHSSLHTVLLGTSHALGISAQENADFTAQIRARLAWTTEPRAPQTLQLPKSAVWKIAKLLLFG